MPRAEYGRLQWCYEAFGHEVWRHMDEFPGAKASNWGRVKGHDGELGFITTDEANRIRIRVKYMSGVRSKMKAITPRDVRASAFPTSTHFPVGYRHYLRLMASSDSPLYVNQDGTITGSCVDCRQPSRKRRCPRCEKIHLDKWRAEGNTYVEGALV